MEKYNVSEYINILKDKGLLNKTVKCEEILNREVEYVSYN